MDSENFARNVLARLGAAGGELPALMIHGSRFGLSALMAMSDDQRRQWGESVAKSIENFLAAVKLGDNCLTFDTDEVTALPESGFMVMQIATTENGTQVSAIVKGQVYPLFRTKMDMGEI